MAFALIIHALVGAALTQNQPALLLYTADLVPTSRLASGSLVYLRTAGQGPSCYSAPSTVKFRSLETGQEFDGVTAKPLDDFCPQTVGTVVPSALPTGRAEVRLTIQRIESRPAQFDVVRTNFGLTARNVRLASGEIASLSQPALAGGMLGIEGTGLGDADRRQIHAELDGQALEFQEAGKGGPGVDVLWFRLPPNLAAEGCYVPLGVRIEGEWRGLLTAPVAQVPGPCRHPLELTANQLAALDEGWSIALGVLTIAAGPDTNEPWAKVDFQLAGAASVAAASSAAVEEGCRLVAQDPINYGQLDAGKATIASFGKVAALPARGLQFPSGEYLLHLTGGIDIDAFDARFQLPQAPVLVTPPAGLVPDKDGSVTIEWDGSSYAEGDLISANVLPGVTCSTRARYGRMRVPVPAGAVTAHKRECHSGRGKI